MYRNWTERLPNWAIAANSYLSSGPLVGPTGAEILSASSTGTDGPGPLANDGLITSARYRVIPEGRGTFAVGALSLNDLGQLIAQGFGTTTYQLYENNTLVVAASNLRTITVQAPSAGGPDTAPPTLTGSVSVSNITQTTASASWPEGTDNVGVSRYELSINNGPWVSVGLVLSRVLTDLVPNTLYGIAVRAVDAAGNASAPPITGSFTTLPTSASGLVPGVRRPDLVIPANAQLIAIRRRKQPRERREYLIDTSAFFAARLDQPASVSVQAEHADGYTISARLEGYLIRINDSGGVTNRVYSTPILLTTTSNPPDVREIDLAVKVQEIR